MSMFTEKEILGYMAGDAPIGYWASNFDMDDNLNATVTELETGDIFTFNMSDAAKKWAESAKDSEYDYWSRCAKDILAEDWDSVDYDAGIADNVIQFGAFGKSVYS